MVVILCTDLKPWMVAVQIQSQSLYTSSPTPCYNVVGCCISHTNIMLTFVP